MHDDEPVHVSAYDREFRAAFADWRNFCAGRSASRTGPAPDAARTPAVPVGIEDDREDGFPWWLVTGAALIALGVVLGWVAAEGFR